MKPFTFSYSPFLISSPSGGLQYGGEEGGRVGEGEKRGRKRRRSLDLLFLFPLEGAGRKRKREREPLPFFLASSGGGRKEKKGGGRGNRFLLLFSFRAGGGRERGGGRPVFDLFFGGGLRKGKLNEPLCLYLYIRTGRRRGKPNRLLPLSLQRGGTLEKQERVRRKGRKERKPASFYPFLIFFFGRPGRRRREEEKKGRKKKEKRGDTPEPPLSMERKERKKGGKEKEARHVLSFPQGQPRGRRRGREVEGECGFQPRVP